VPTAAQPLSRSIDTGLDTFGYALHDLKPGDAAATGILNVARSVQSIQYTSGAGVCTYKTRQSRFTASSSVTFANADVHAIEVPASREGLYNVVRATLHPPRTQAAIVLWSSGTAATPQEILAGRLHHHRYLLSRPRRRPAHRSAPPRLPLPSRPPITSPESSPTARAMC
jgi:hypothetical protein